MEDFRIEKKIILGKYKDFFIKKKLLEKGFVVHFPDREITSIYLDTLNYDNARDNINGVSERKKIRLRWYDNNLNKIFIEEKKKNNFTVWKSIKEVDFNFFNYDNIENVQNNLNINNNKFLKNNNFDAILQTNYRRSYFILRNLDIRATIDINLQASSFKYKKNSVEIPDTILEFKFSPNKEKIFRNFFRENFSELRANKYSKYIRSFIALEESGFKI